MKTKNNRRSFLKNISLATFSTLALSGCNMKEIDEFLQGNFRELTPEEKDEIVKNLAEKYKKRYGKDFTVSDTPAMVGVLFGYALDISRCIGCRKCVTACVKENNQSRDPQIQWIQVLEMEKERGVDLHHSNINYDHEKVPEKGHFYFPVQCQQCRNPQCVTVCPAKATWQEKDGIVVVDYNWCIGCRYCMAACPYGARHFNWGEPSIPADEINTEVHYLGNRPRQKGVVEKCTFCVQRVREGKYPACVEICPVGARKFGNLLDPESEVRYILDNKRVLVLKQELNTQPKFYYYFG
ncbi:MAG: 4Fe-4S dicluster domain-containing protein [Flavobacteriaceae bacterium]|nr:4Fe-4S dicluster domain-containing protein [Flavobacteriaceae bacterium]